MTKADMTVTMVTAIIATSFLCSMKLKSSMH